MNNENKKTIANTQSKLRLKRNNSDSSQTPSLNLKCSTQCNTNIQENSNNDESPYKKRASSSSNIEDDSLADFKSPKEEKSHKVILNKFKIDAEKVKKKIIKSKSKSNTKSRKSISTINQPSIESSFFKPQTSNLNDIKESVPCPLCLKPFKDDTSCTNHMKTCAAKNKVSVRQLLSAKQLQDRQAEERKALGLLAAPVLPERKKAFRSKNYSTGDDPQLQLVLAMSESLYEAERIVELEQAALLAGIPSECIKEMNDEDRKSTLQSFGFTTNKPVSEVPSNKTKKRKLLGPTILQTRSKEDKDRVLTERIACILTGDDALTQVQKENCNVLQKNSPKILRSRILKEIHQAKNGLWDRSRLRKNYDFYVKELKSHFLKLNKNLQQTDSNNSDLSFCESNNDNEQNNLMNCSIEYDPIDIDIIMNHDKDQNNFDIINTSKSESTNCELDFMRNLVSCWGEALNDSAASDVIIFVKDNKHIYAHKLVFHVQCPNILVDIGLNDTESHPQIKQKISWLEKHQLSALAFLEFIYCGMISKNTDVFKHQDLLSEVKNFARVYRVKELFTYLRIKQNEVLKPKESKNINDTMCKESCQSNANNNNQVLVNNSTLQLNDFQNLNKEDTFFDVQPIQTHNYLTKCTSDPTPLINKSIIKKNNSRMSSKVYNTRQSTASPNLFESEDEETEKIYSCPTQITNDKERQENSTNLNILVDVINENEDDNISNSSNTIIQNMEIYQNRDKFDKTGNLYFVNSSSQKTISNLSRSQTLIPTEFEDDKSTISLYQENVETEENQDDKSIVQNIHNAVTPPRRSSTTSNNRTLEISNDDYNKIIKALTPLKRLTNKDIDIKLEKMNDDDQNISEAITPKNLSPERYIEITEKEDYCNDQISIDRIPESHTSFKLQNSITPKTIYTNLEDDLLIDGHDNALINEKIIEKSDDSIHDVVTPPTSPKPSEKQSVLNKNNTKEKKTDISLFIAKAHKINAKGLLESDSETDSPIPPVKCKNPFLKRQHYSQDDSYAYLKNDGHSNDQIPRRVLSLLEKDVIEGEKKVTVINKKSSDTNYKNNNTTLSNSNDTQDVIEEHSNVNLSSEIRDDFSVLDNSTLAVNSKVPSSKTESTDFKLPDNVTTRSYTKKQPFECSISNDEVEDITLNDSELSMYSRYKKSKKHDNSIAKYRKELKNLNQSVSGISANTDVNEKEILNNTSTNTSKKILLQNNTKSNLIEDITLVSDSDDEEEQNKSNPIVKSKKPNENVINEKFEKKNSTFKSPLGPSVSNIENDSTFPLELVGDKFEPSQVVNSTELKEKYKNEIIDIAGDSDEESIHDDSTFPYKLAIESDNSLKNKKNNSKDSCTSENKEKEVLELLEKNSDDFEAEISKHLPSSPKFINQNNTKDCKLDKENKFSQEKHKTASNENFISEQDVINLSPISIISSPGISEFHKHNLSNIKSSGSKKDNSLKGKIIESNSIVNEYFDIDFDNDDNWVRKSPLKKDSVKTQSFESALDVNYSSKKRLNFENTSLGNNSIPTSNLSLPLTESENIQTQPLCTSPVLSQSKRKSQISCSVSPKLNKNEIGLNKPSEESSEKTRKLKIKSISATNFTEQELYGRKLKRSSSTSVSPEKSKKVTQKSDESKDVTPPVNYSTLGTPELHKELSKFGLKPQSRNKAKLLLRHIYNETHPVVSASQKRVSSPNSTSDDEQPPLKKKNLKKTSSKASTSKEKKEIKSARSSQNCQMIAEEMVNDEPEAVNNLPNSVSIKDAFFRLIETNKELYTKVLTYEPLPLDTLHLMLKQTGFKCKTNSLMDFLDEQCITFQVQGGKNNRTRKKK